jgi:hypothetical protein
MRTSLKGRVVWITGASSGIGAITARKLAEKGAIPVLTARSAGKLRDVAATIGGEHAAMELDVTDPDAAAATAARIHERFGRIDVLLNNAGYGEFIPFADAPLSHFQDIMDVNYMGAVRCIKAALPYMEAAGDGHIVNVASIAGKLGTAKSTAYTASKHALLGFTNALRQELAGTGIAVSAINPGPIDTPFFDRADPDGTYVRNVRWFMLKPDKVADAIVSLMETRKAEKDLPWTASAGAKLVQLFPGLTSGILGRLTNKK